MKEHTVIRDLLALAAAHMLEPSEEERVQKHLNHCEACRTELHEWLLIAGALKELPLPQAPPRLATQTTRLLSHVAFARKQQASQLGIAFLIAFSWLVAFMTVEFFRLFDMSLAQRLNVSSTTVWVAYIGVTWLATALAAGLLGKHWQREGKTV